MTFGMFPDDFYGSVDPIIQDHKPYIDISVVERHFLTTDTGVDIKDETLGIHRCN